MQYLPTRQKKKTIGDLWPTGFTFSIIDTVAPSGLWCLRSFLTIFKRTLKKNRTNLNKFIRDWLVGEGYDKGIFFQFSFFRFDFYFSFVENSSGSQIFVFIYFQKFNFQRLHIRIISRPHISFYNILFPSKLRININTNTSSH